MASQIDPSLTEPHVSNRVIISFLVYFREQHGASFVTDIVTDAGLTVDYFDDTEGWVSRTFVERFVASVSKRLYDLDDPPGTEHPLWQEWREVGRMNLRPDLIGPLYHVLRALGSPDLFFRQAPSLVQRANRVTGIALDHQVPGLSVMRIWSKDPDFPDQPWACHNRIGIFEAVPELWGLGRAVVEHHACMHDPAHPAEACVYRIRYPQRALMGWLSLVVIGTVFALLGAVLCKALGQPQLGGLGALIGAIVATGAEGWRRYLKALPVMREDGRELGELLEESDTRYRHLWNEGMELRRSLLTTRKISGYLPVALVDRILQNPETESQYVERIEAAVLFADLVDFTSRCERKDAEQVVDELNTFFDHIDPMVRRHDGVIDKRLGDALMAVFVQRDPNESSDSIRRRAVSCGLDMLAAIGTCNEELIAKSGEPLHVRIGVAAGPVVRGNIGSSLKLEYTVIGDVVNLAARLQSSAAHDHLLVPHELHVRAGEPGNIVRKRTIGIKGKTEPINAVELSP